MVSTAQSNKRTVVLHAVGYLSYSVVFNVLNTIVYSALYPKILEHITHGDKKRYTTAFSNINFATTLFSAVTLPFIGSWVDSASAMKQTMLVTQYCGMLSTALLFFLGKLPNDTYKWQEAQLFLNELLYVLSMFFLRISVMANNAMLPLFNKKHVTVLSLVNSLLGFVVNLGGLLILMLIPESALPDEVWGISIPNWWLLIFTVLTLMVSVFTFLAPSGVKEQPTTITATTTIRATTTTTTTATTISTSTPTDQIEDSAHVPLVPVNSIEVMERVRQQQQEEHDDTEQQLQPSAKRVPFLRRHRRILIRSFRNVMETFRNWNKKRSYYQSWIFLLSYLFYSTSGTVCTIFLGPLFIDIYDLGFAQEVGLNLYFKMAMIVGIFVGILVDKIVRINDVIMLMVHNSLFAILMMLAFLAISFKATYVWVLWIFLIVGLLYSWNLSVSRAVISKLLPPEKKCEFMGLYSTFTYLGISIVSLINSMLRSADLPTHILLLILFIWLIPAYLFLAILYQTMKKSDRLSEAKSETIDNNAGVVNLSGADVSSPRVLYQSKPSYDVDDGDEQ